MRRELSKWQGAWSRAGTASSNLMHMRRSEGWHDSRAGEHLAISTARGSAKGGAAGVGEAPEARRVKAGGVGWARAKGGMAGGAEGRREAPGVGRARAGSWGSAGDSGSRERRSAASRRRSCARSQKQKGLQDAPTNSAFAASVQAPVAPRESRSLAAFRLRLRPRCRLPTWRRSSRSAR